MQPTKDQVISALSAFAAQRPGIEPGNYSDWRSYRAESRSVTRDLHDARYLLRQCELWGVSVEELRGAFRAFSGRLVPSVNEKGFCLDYCTGQYFPTEYRKAVCAVCAAALWDHFREDFAKSAKEGESAGDAIRRNFRRMFGARIARRWFD